MDLDDGEVSRSPSLFTAVSLHGAPARSTRGGSLGRGQRSPRKRVLPSGVDEGDRQQPISYRSRKRRKRIRLAGLSSAESDSPVEAKTMRTTKYEFKGIVVSPKKPREIILDTEDELPLTDSIPSESETITKTVRRRLRPFDAPRMAAKEEHSMSRSLRRKIDRFVSSSGSSESSDDLKAPDAPIPEEMYLARAKDRGGEFQTLEGNESVGNVTWGCIGGLSEHIERLKEMVLLPLLYPEVYQRFGIAPPRGVLFHGPPGTGKTLVARALAHELSMIHSRGGQPVSFFLRKGADCLSKWVGEAERQLRLLFTQARRRAPSIVFFDEIDGLAPARSSRHDHTHNSVVATLLALMDSGMENPSPLGVREEEGSYTQGGLHQTVIVVGATNRIDSLDPALRRPGRFDRELLFSLPDEQARREIIGIHSRCWNPPIEESLLNRITERSSGMSGADLRALVTEAALAAFRRTYPQVYGSDQRLLIDANSIRITSDDFEDAFGAIVPSASRASTNPARPLISSMTPLLSDALRELRQVVDGSFRVRNSDRKAQRHRDDVVQSLKVLISGPPRCGQFHLGAALLHSMDGAACHDCSWHAVHAHASAVVPEHALAIIVHAAIASAPSVLFFPDIDDWWDHALPSLRHTLSSLMSAIPPNAAVLFVATCQRQAYELDAELSTLFLPETTRMYTVSRPSHDHRRLFFGLVSEAASTSVPEFEGSSAPLPVAPPTPLRKPSLQELQDDEVSMCELRIFLRGILRSLRRKRSFQSFASEVSHKDYPEYAKVIQHPMNFDRMEKRIVGQKYRCVEDFLRDVDLIAQNAITYNPRGHELRLRAKELVDHVMLMAREIDRTLVMKLRRSAERRRAFRAQAIEHHRQARRRAHPIQEEDQSTPGVDGGLLKAAVSGLDDLWLVLEMLVQETEDWDIDALMTLLARCMMICSEYRDVTDRSGLVLALEAELKRMRNIVNACSAPTREGISKWREIDSLSQQLPPPTPTSSEAVRLAVTEHREEIRASSNSSALD